MKEFMSIDCPIMFFLSILFFSYFSKKPKMECQSAVDQMTTSNSDNQFVDPERAALLLKGLGMLYEQKTFSDVSLVAEGRRFPCHRALLAISSPYFMTMFSTDLCEKNQSEITIQEMEAPTLELILDYIYTGQVTMSEDRVQHLLSAANLFQLLALRNGCADYMMKHLNVSNCIGVYFFAHAHNCDQLASKAKELINSQFELLCHESEFLSLPPDKLIKIIQDDRLNVSKEEIVFEACSAWLFSNFEERKPYLYQVMRHVRFANISSYYFCDRIVANTILQSDSALNKVLDDVKYYHMLRNRHSEVDLNLLPRKGMQYSRAVIIMANPYAEDNSGKFNNMEVLFPRSGLIKTLCTLPQCLYMPGTSSVKISSISICKLLYDFLSAACTTGENHVYLAGGALRKSRYQGPFHSEGISKNLFLYDGSWQVRAKLLHSRYQFSLVFVDG
jgi:hypothetical protein